jgi:hypothetical protein
MGEKRYGFQDARAKKVWNFVWLNVLAVGATLLLFFLILYGDATTRVFASTWDWFSDHQVLMALAASTPFFAALLVGRASAAKAKRKRLAEARRLADEEAARAREARAKRPAG